MSEEEEYHVKNDDETDESHKSQLKFEYEVYLLNYTIKIKLIKNQHCWSFIVFLQNLKILGF